MKKKNVGVVLQLAAFGILIQLHLHQPRIVQGGYGFITTAGTQFMLNGSPFYAHGFNAYWLMFVASEPSHRYMVSDAFRNASSHGLSLARTWAFHDAGYRPLQYSPGSYDEQVFKALDFVIGEAGKCGVKLILSLVNNYDNFGGKKQYVNWARSQGQYLTSDDDFFTNSVVKGYFKNHIKTVLNRYNTVTGVVYKNDPAIMAWELMNEPRCTSDPSGRNIQAWITEMAAYLKSIDSNHLLEVGLEGFYGAAHPQRMSLSPRFTHGTDFIANNQVPGIDFATIHSYPEQWFPRSNDESQLSFLSNWIDAHIQDSQNILRKPLLLTEFGRSWKDPGYSTYRRDRVFATAYDKIYSSARSGGAAAGGLFWQLLTAGLDNFRDGYEVILSESSSTENMIAQEAHKMTLLRKMFARMRNIARLKRARTTRHGKGKGIGN